MRCREWLEPVRVEPQEDRAPDQGRDRRCGDVDTA